MMPRGAHAHSAPPEAAAPKSTAVIRGYLVKRPVSHSFGAAKRRYLTLVPTVDVLTRRTTWFTLSWFKDEDEAVPNGEMRIESSSSVSLSTDQKGQHDGLCVKAGDSELHLAAAPDGGGPSLGQWAEAIGKARDSLRAPSLRTSSSTRSPPPDHRIPPPDERPRAPGVPAGIFTVEAVAHSWQSEWAALRLEEYKITGQFAGEDEKWVEKNDSPAAFIERNRVKVEWKIRAGWPTELAEAYTCVASGGLCSIGRAIREESAARWAACAYVVRDALCGPTAFVAGAPPAPPCFRHLSGRFGLANNDPAWKRLLRPHVEPGTSFVTSTITMASDDSACFQDRKGYRVELTYSNEKGRSYEVQDSDVVCILSSARDEHGLHSLVQVAAGSYHAPPLTSVTLERVQAPGEWQAYGTAVRRRLFTVSLAFLAGGVRDF